MNSNVDFPSGNWTGFYLESHRREPGWMHLHLVCDPQGAIQGEGVDYVGPWTLLGNFLLPNKQCVWTKRYVGRHKVTYDGQLSSDGIRGEWHIEPFLEGRFHIWPESMAHWHEQYLREGLPRRADDPALDSREKMSRG